MLILDASLFRCCGLFKKLYVSIFWQNKERKPKVKNPLPFKNNQHDLFSNYWSVFYFTRILFCCLLYFDKQNLQMLLCRMKKYQAFFHEDFNLFAQVFFPVSIENMIFITQQISNYKKAPHPNKTQRNNSPLKSLRFPFNPQYAGETFLYETCYLGEGYYLSIEFLVLQQVQDC